MTQTVTEFFYHERVIEIVTRLEVATENDVQYLISSLQDLKHDKEGRRLPALDLPSFEDIRGLEGEVESDIQESLELVWKLIQDAEPGEEKGYWLFRLAALQTDPELQIKYLKSSLEEDPTSHFNNFYMALALENQGFLQLEEALGYARKCLDQVPEHRRVLALTRRLEDAERLYSGPEIDSRSESDEQSGVSEDPELTKLLSSLKTENARLRTENESLRTTTAELNSELDNLTVKYETNLQELAKRGRRILC